LSATLQDAPRQDRAADWRAQPRLRLAALLLCGASFSPFPLILLLHPSVPSCTFFLRGWVPSTHALLLGGRAASRDCDGRQHASAPLHGPRLKTLRARAGLPSRVRVTGSTRLRWLPAGRQGSLRCAVLASYASWPAQRAGMAAQFTIHGSMRSRRADAVSTAGERWTFLPRRNPLGIEALPPACCLAPPIMPKRESPSTGNFALTGDQPFMLNM